MLAQKKKERMMAKKQQQADTRSKRMAFKEQLEAQSPKVYVLKLHLRAQMQHYSTMLHMAYLSIYFLEYVNRCLFKFFGKKWVGVRRISCHEFIVDAMTRIIATEAIFFHFLLCTFCSPVTFLM